MTSNVGATNRTIRIVLGIILVVLGFAYFVTGGAASAAYAVAAIALGTGVVRYCPAWSIFGINTCPRKPGQCK
jgi:hypothetical protein